MKRHLSIAAFGLFILQATALAQASKTYTVNKIDAFLVSGQSGKISANIIDPKQPFALWNTVIGEGDAGEPANDVLVVVHVETTLGDGELPPLTLKAIARGDQSVLTERKDIYVPFLDQLTGTASILLHGVTCMDLDVQVLAADKIIKTVQIPFACGE